MANRMMASLAVALTLSLVVLDLSSADAGVDLPDKAGTALVALPHEYVFKSEIATADVVLPIGGNLEFLKGLQVHDPENSETKEDQNSKRDDENEAWLEFETESVVGVVQPSDSDSDPFTVIQLSHSQHNCRHKPWFRELPHSGESSKYNGEDVSLDSMILGVMHLEQGQGHANLKKHGSMPHRGGVGNIHRVRGFERLDDQESMEEKTESQEKEDDKSEKEDDKPEKEAKEEQKEEEVENTEAEPKDVKAVTEAKEEKEEKAENQEKEEETDSKETEQKEETQAKEDLEKETTDELAENQEKEEETDSKETEQKEETQAKEDLEKETTDDQVHIWLNRFRKFMNF